MPQMMPMFWLLMIMNLIFILLLVSSFLYFFHYPVFYPNPKNKDFNFFLIWKW